MYTNISETEFNQPHSWHAECMASVEHTDSNGMPSGTALLRASRRQRATRPQRGSVAAAADKTVATVGFKVPTTKVRRSATVRSSNLLAQVGFANTTARTLVGHSAVGLPTGSRSATTSGGITALASGKESGIFSSASDLSCSQSSVSSSTSRSGSSSSADSDDSLELSTSSTASSRRSIRSAKPKKAKKFLGVLGGMGPLATADFLSKLAANTTAGQDQQHVPVLLYGDCSTPDRTACILGDGPSPLPSLLDGIEFLNSAPSVSAICIPCNSAHCWYEEMASASDVPVFHIVKASADQVRQKKPDCKTVGVLSTQGTHQMGMYRKTLGNMGFNVVCPTDDEFERLVSPAIHMIKTNEMEHAEELFAEATALLEARGAEIVILGCTEIPVGMKVQYEANPDKFVDSNEALALSVADFFAKI